jgi:hypothetical protein
LVEMKTNAAANHRGGLPRLLANFRIIRWALFSTA